MKHIGLIMSAGKGLRFGGDTPKQYIEINGMPVICYAIRAMEESFIDEIILVVASGDEEYVKENIVDKFSFAKISKIVPGGAERFDSVRAGLSAVTETDSFIYIQDAARPMLTTALLDKLKEDAFKYEATVLGVRAKDTIKRVSEKGNVIDTPKRSELWQIQTPQVFKFDIIKKAYDEMERDADAFVTDDAEAVEKYTSHFVHVTEGDYRNIKITTPEDLVTAENNLK